MGYFPNNFFSMILNLMGTLQIPHPHHHPLLPLPSGGTWQYLETILVVTTGNWSWDTTGIYLWMLQHTRQAPQQRLIGSPISIVQRLRNPTVDFHSFKWSTDWWCGSSKSGRCCRCWNSEPSLLISRPAFVLRNPSPCTPAFSLFTLIFWTVPSNCLQPSHFLPPSHMSLPLSSLYCCSQHSCDHLAPQENALCCQASQMTRTRVGTFLVTEIPLHAREITPFETTWYNFEPRQHLWLGSEERQSEKWSEVAWGGSRGQGRETKAESLHRRVGDGMDREWREGSGHVFHYLLPSIILSWRGNQYSCLLFSPQTFWI